MRSNLASSANNKLTEKTVGSAAVSQELLASRVQHRRAARKIKDTCSIIWSHLCALLGQLAATLMAQACQTAEPLLLLQLQLLLFQL